MLLRAVVRVHSPLPLPQRRALVFVVSSISKQEKELRLKIQVTNDCDNSKMRRANPFGKVNGRIWSLLQRRAKLPHRTVNVFHALSSG